MTLIIKNIAPPVPSRAFDWICYEDGQEDGLHAYGSTAKEAVDQWFEYHEELLNEHGRQVEANILKKYPNVI